MNDDEALLWELERHITATDRDERAGELDLSELASLADLEEAA